jgi:predicted RecB family nuclease
MKQENQKIIFSPTDLANHLSCNYITVLNKKVLQGEIERPKVENRVLDSLRQKGLEFEDNFLTKLINDGLNVVKIEQKDPLAEENTIKAMKNGADVIFQARLVEKDQWAGWSDFVLKVPGQSDLGNWQYEVMDTKLSNETRAGAILQISLYSEKIGAIQGKMPLYMHIEKPDGRSTFRVDEYMAYFRLAKKRLVEAIEDENFTGYPEPITHCDICNWFLYCNKKRRQDDHLGFIANMGKSQIKEVRRQNIFTLKDMAQAPYPLPFKPSRGNIETLNKLREQARLQLEERETGATAFEFLEVEENRGLNLLPAPNKHDIYLDLEGDTMVEPDGREYLFGWIYQNEYHSIWAETAERELEGFEDFMDFAYGVKLANPDMHIYHYAPYEVTAFKRLMGKYATKSVELDYFLRSGGFIDLYAVVRQSLIASVEKYSIKNLEKFYDFEREMELRELGKIKAEYEFLLESDCLEAVDPMMRESIQTYNYDDCASTVKLHQWLETLRTNLLNQGNPMTRPVQASGEATENINAFQELITPIFNALMEDGRLQTLAYEERTKEENANYILAHMLDWYNREDKSVWWEYYELKNSLLDELFENRKAISYLINSNNRFQVKRSFVDSYTFPKQEADIKSGEKVKLQTGQEFGEVYMIDHRSQTIQIKKNNKFLDVHPDGIIKSDYYDPKDKKMSIVDLAKWVSENGIDHPSNEFKSARELLLNHIPNTTEPVHPEEDFIAKSIDWALKLDHSTLPTQGPPGTGKSFTCSHMIIGLIQEGKKIGISAMSHKVIQNLLYKIDEIILEQNLTISIVQKVSPNFEGEERWFTSSKNPDIFAQMGNANILAGTPFMWSHPSFIDSVDYLIIDEAGQLSLIDTLSIARAGKNLILLGDPQQLQQPVVGVHPAGTEVSALQHILGEHQTISDEQGIFLAKTWRLHPDICEFISEMFYDHKLKPVQRLENQSIQGNPRYAGSGLRIRCISHEGNVNSSEEEIDEIKQIVTDLLSDGMTYVNKDLESKPITANDIKIISPYNAQVQALMEAIPGIEVGTVDKFQGQEAPIIIYSVATSSPEEAPRGMEFLYSPNRFNVAVSRAKALFIMVANRKIFEPECKSPAQIKLANPFCRYLEVATEI